MPLPNFTATRNEESMDSLIHPNGISDEPLKDIWGNDLVGEYPPDKGEAEKEDAGNFKLDFKKSEKYFPQENYLLNPQEKYDKMYMENYSNEFSSEKTKDEKTHVTYGCEDENIVGGIQLRLKEMGYKGKSGAEINITGTFDKNTEEGIKQFQEDRGLTVTGILDDATKEETACQTLAE